MTSARYQDLTHILIASDSAKASLAKLHFNFKVRRGVFIQQEMIFTFTCKLFQFFTLEVYIGTMCWNHHSCVSTRTKFSYICNTSVTLRY